MKKILLAAIILAGFSSCSNDSDEQENIQNATVVGLWKPVKYRVVSGSDTNKILSSSPVDDCEKKSAYNFKSDGMASITLYEDNGGACLNIGTETSPYSYDATSKILTFDGEPIPVVTLTDNIFELIDVDYEDDYNNDGIVDKMIFTLIK